MLHQQKTRRSQQGSRKTCQFLRIGACLKQVVPLFIQGRPPTLFVCLNTQGPCVSAPAIALTEQEIDFLTMAVRVLITSPQRCCSTATAAFCGCFHRICSTADSFPLRPVHSEYNLKSLVGHTHVVSSSVRCFSCVHVH